jgi:hypothetical protein
MFFQTGFFRFFAESAPENRYLLLPFVFVALPITLFSVKTPGIVDSPEAAAVVHAFPSVLCLDFP